MMLFIKVLITVGMLFYEQEEQVFKKENTN